MPENCILHFNNIFASYGAINALNGVDIKINEGEIVSLIGSNGAGKSSLMMSLFGKPPVGKGDIVFQGKSVKGLPAHDIGALGIALVPEGRRIFPSMTIEENLLMGLINYQRSRRGKSDRSLNSDTALKKVYDWFDILGKRRLQRAGTLSGGEQQMLAIGRAIVSKPKILLLDEPSLGLAPLIVKQIFEILAEIADSGVTLFLVEQNAKHALTLAHRGYVMVNGKITLTGIGSDLLANPEIKNAYLGGG